MLPNPSDLKYFLELYKIKNISRAAESLGITQPSLSLSLKRLESALDIQLFIRSKSGVIPTKGADLLSKDVESLLDSWSRVAEKAKNSVEMIKGKIVVGCHPSVALYSVSPWLKSLAKDNNQLEVEFCHDLSRKLLEQIVSFKIDLGLIINPISHPDLVIKYLLTDEVTLRVAKGVNFDGSTIIYDPNLSQVQSILSRLKKRKIEIKRHITSTNLEFIEHLTSKGIGIGVLPSRVCKSPMKIYDSSIKPFKDQLALVYRADTPKTKSFQVVLDSIKKAFL